MRQRLPSGFVTRAGSGPEWLDGEASSRAQASQRAEVDAEAGERRRADAASASVGARLPAVVGQPLTVSLLGGHRASGQLRDVGDGWLWLASGQRGLVVRTRACLTVDGLPSGAGPASDPSRSRTGPGHPLRSLMRTRRPVAVLLVDGRRLTGTLAQVGADAVDLVEHPVDRPPQPHDPVTTVLWQGVAAVGAA
jgi:small nuclear ribonucleoprotein (snRNP)-like protein